MKFKTKDLDQLIWEGETEDGALVKVDDRPTGKSRWSIPHELVFRHVETGKLYRAEWQEPATESQHDGLEGRWDYSDEQDCPEVWAHEVTTTVYRTEPPA